MKKPSVTELVKLLDKPALLKWANKQGLAGIDISKKKQEWLDAGSSMHNQIEGYLRDGTKFISQEDQDRFEVFMSGKKLLSFESQIETEWFTGRYDIEIDWGGRNYIMDFKKDNKGIRSIYFEDKLQLVAYSMARPCDHFAIVSTPSFRVMNFTIENKEPYIEILKALSIIYQQKQLIDAVNF